MRPLLNLLLLCAAFSASLSMYLMFFYDPPGLSERINSALGAIGAVVAFGVLIGLVLAICGKIGAFPWLPAMGAVAAVAVLAAYVAIVLLWLLTGYVAMEAIGAAHKFGIATIWAARLCAVGLPVMVWLYPALAINGPDALPLHRAALGIIAVLCLIATAVTVQELVRWERIAASQAESLRRQETERPAAARRAFAALTDADSLEKWQAFLAYGQPDDVRAEALRRISARRGLETELIAALASEDTALVREALSLAARTLPSPSAALAKPFRDAVAVLAEEYEVMAQTVNPDADRRIDYFEAATLDAVLEVSLRLAQRAGIDLRDALARMSAAVALFPTSPRARAFRGEVAETVERIAAALTACVDPA